MSTTPVRQATTLRREELHAGIVDPDMDSMRLLSETAMRFPDALSFSSGAPHDGTHDLAKLSYHVDRYIRHLRQRGVPEQRITRLHFQYGPVNGFIQEEVARMLVRDEDIDVAPEAIMITHGFQEAALVALRGLFRSPDDVLLSVSPAYVGIRGAARMLDIPVKGITEGPDGLEPEAVAAAVRAVRAEGKRPAALYLVPDFSNPSGTVVPLEARRRLLALAAEEGFTILEDNPYGLFASDEERLPTLKSLDTRGDVVYLGSFAKSAFPGARLGYLVGDREVVGEDGVRRTLAQELSKAKAMFTVGSSSLSQAAIGGILVDADHDLRTATRDLAAIYQERLAATLDALAEHFPPERYAEHGVRWNRPRGGFFLVVEVPFEADLPAMERSARDHAVSWAPMSMFHLEGGGERALRLGFSNLTPAAIREGIARLAGFIRAESAIGPVIEVHSASLPEFMSASEAHA
ncbi:MULTISPECIES: PLP-dependent aminotransferase family protein [unclassified Streptomyces]|uniref:aminotransferase-like domain-containing protein n=1 Tax=unclassified Streptomyces TaxID=2593676 RepID=UPI002475D624|nr:MULTISPECIES: PLP-dependent aminotransferase family protein [unclassified Streptomyces]MDH6451824.1 (S)-3,5-dihydroxyphenylglycine transaminase [Streptomyces sp. SAI-119]MDH6497619.1 (S)-3,5-dihydroxyphenylglycine transaminase [Streptomyces sp. SAI-149]